MMFEVPDLVVLILVFGVGWLAYRWLNGTARGLEQRRAAASRRAIPAEELVACGVCGAYVPARAAGCDRPDCPQPR
ncbi:MAG TPA: hypothetical protein VMF05_05065 [Stellaceae bacterium]|jgi:hypothetical protein|nr:hypothetical protein [Stellaceae bacterium]